MKKKVIILIVIIILIIVAVVNFYNKQQTAELDKVYVRLKWIYHSQFMGFFTADQKGFYNDQGINAILTPGGAESPSIQMVAGGGEQFGVTGMSQLMEARVKGVPVVALAVIYRKNPLIWFSINEEVDSAEDLVGRKVGVTIGSNSDILFRAMLKKAGVDIEKVERVPVTYNILPVLTGQVDAYEGYIINQPILAQEKGFKTYIINPVDYGINFYADTLFTTEKMIKENPDLVRRFVRATLEGWEYAYSHPEEAVNYTLMYNDQLNREHETVMTKISLDLLKPDNKSIGTIDRKVLEEMHDLLISNNILENPLDLDNLYTTQFLE